MKKVILILALCFLLVSCNQKKQYNYANYKQMNESIEVSNCSFEVTECFVNPIDVCSNPAEKIITITITWNNSERFTSSDAKIIDLDNHQEYSFYTTDGLDYLAGEDAYIRFKVSKEQNHFILLVTKNQENVEVHIEVI